MSHDIDDFMTIEQIDSIASEAEATFCEQLDHLIGENALIAALNGTLYSKLIEITLDEAMFERLRGTILVSEHAAEIDDRELILRELATSLWGVAQYFYLCDLEITDNWYRQMSESHIPDAIQTLPESEFTSWVLAEGRRRGMEDHEIFAVIGYLCIGESNHLSQ